ncbi:MAG: hypothetical protein Q4P09_04135 [Phascolarctobacterium sp.]|nr:hypothetical protein [Phascolarctobacterium sp.]
MKSSWKINVLALGCALAVAGPAAAADTLLAKTALWLEQGSATAELWGDRLPNGYSGDLLVLLKDEKGKLMTAFAPSIKGGYHPLLAAVQVKPIAKEQARSAGNETTAAAQSAAGNAGAAQQGPSATKAAAQQLLVSVGQGDWQAPREFRVLDFADVQKVMELFSSGDSMGLVSKAYINEEKLYVTLKDGQQNSTALPKGVDGSKLYYGGLHSLTAFDVDGDGQEELLGAQQLVGGRLNVADVGAVWQLDSNGQWKLTNMTIMTATPTPKSNTVNDGKEVATGVILPCKMVVPGGEATYPVFVSDDVELQNKINKLLAAECSEYLGRFYKGRADMAFKVIAASEKLVSLQLISGKTKFVHHHINFDPQTGELMKLEQVLNYKDPDLMPLLRLLCNNKAMMLEYQPPAEWYLEGNNLFLMQNICGQDEVAGFALGNLHKFILDKRWLEKNLTDQSADFEIRRKRK